MTTNMIEVARRIGSDEENKLLEDLF